MAKQTAGRNILGEFAPQFAALNDDVLFGEVWSREAELPAKMRSIVTISALVGKGIVDTSLQYHLAAARENGVTREEMVEILTQLAFYAGWPNAWAAFRMAKDVYFDDSRIAADADADMVVGDRIVESEVIGNEQIGPGSYGGLFGLGELNEAYAEYFTGKSYLNKLSHDGDPITIFNVTFEPGCRNNWHIHHAESGGGQVLICMGGQGWYQAWGEAPRALKPGDIVEIPANVKHWHGAASDSWFSHLAFEIPGTGTSTEWCEPVSDADYLALDESDG